jgi:hypothetical protein
VEEMSHPSK